MSQIDSLPDLTEFRPRPLPDLSAFMPPNPGILHNAAGAATSLAAASDPERPNRAARTDALVHAGRAATPQAVLDQRAVPRASIAELNQMDGDLLRQRFEQIRRDDRSPTEQVLDLIDLPRNTIANIMWGKPSAAGVAATVGASAAAGAGIGAFGGLAGAGVGGLSGAAIGLGAEGLAALGRQLGGRVNTEQSPTAALGQKQIFVSDALQKLGVENRVIRAILGFAGDVLIDPLTYVGPPGWGLRLTAQVGKGATEVLHLTGSAGRAIRSATTKLAAGAELGTDLERAAGAFALKEAGHTPETIAAAKAAGKSASEIAGELRAAVSGKSASGVIEKSFRPLGGELGYEGSGLVKRFHDPVVEAGDAADLAKRFVELGGRGSGRALRIGVKSGDVGSQVLHVPFGGLLWPEASVQVPAFSAAAKNAARARVVAMQRAIGVGNAFSHTPQAAAQVVDGSSKLNELAGEMRAATMEHPIRTREQDDLIDALRKRRPPEPPSAPSGPDMPKPPEPPPGPGPTVPPPGTPPTGGAGGAAHVAPYLPDQDTGQDLGKLLDDADAAAKAGETIPKPPTPPSERERVYAEAHAAFSNLPENEREANLILLRHAVETRAKAAGVTPDEIWKTIRFGTDGEGKGQLYSIGAWHGSPHVFDKFSTSKIGTGEGAQAYGHGLYFTSSQDVAKWYKEKLAKQIADNPQYWENVKLPETLSSFEWNEYIDLSGKLRSSGPVSPHGLNRFQVLADKKRAYEDAVDAARPRGRLYKTTLAPEEHELLDWDKPISDQSLKVRDALWSLIGDPHNYAKYGRDLVGEGVSGKDYYHALAYDAFHGKGNPYEDMAASRMLRDRGVRGIAYKGEASGVRNYVIFDDADVKIDEVLHQALKGSFSVENGRSVIRAFAAHDPSTMIHEMGHLFRTWLPPEDLSVVSRVYGVDPATWGKRLTANGLRRPAEERFAQDLERYVATGDLPNLPNLSDAERSVLSRAFQTIRDAIVELYKSIVGTPLEKELSPELKGVFDRMIGGEGVRIGKMEKGPTGFSLAAVEDRLIAAGDEHAHLIDTTGGAGVGEDYGIHDTGSRAFSDEDFSTNFPNGLTGEAKHAIEGRPHLRKLLSTDPGVGRGTVLSGEESMARMGDAWLEALERMAQSKSGRAKDAIRAAGPTATPEARFLADLHDDLPRPSSGKRSWEIVYDLNGQQQRRQFNSAKGADRFRKDILTSDEARNVKTINPNKPLSQAEKAERAAYYGRAKGGQNFQTITNPQDLPPGTTFKIAGQEYTILDSEYGKVLSGPRGQYELSGLARVPFDEGSIKMAGAGEEVPTVDIALGGDAGDDIPFSPGGALYQKGDLPGQSDIFGRNVGPSGEKQGGLFGDVSAPPKPTLSAAELAAKYPGIRPGETAADFERRMGTADTGMLFQGGSSELDAAIAERKAMDEAYTARIAALHEAMKAELDKMEAAVATIDPAAHNSPASINAALGLMQSVRQAQANSEHATAQYNLWKNLRGIAPTVATADPEHVVRQLTNLADGDDELLRVMDSLVHDNPEALSDLQAAAERSMEAAQKHEGILQQDVIALASKEEGILSELAKSFLGITDEHQARSLFAPIGSALQTWGAQRAADTAFGMDRWWRKTFNARGGLDQRIYADIAHNFNQGASETQYRWLQRIRQTVADQMPKGVTPEQLDKAHAIFFGHLYSAADPGGHSYRMWDFGDKATSTGPKLDEAGKIVNKSQLVRMMEEAQSDGLFANGIAANLKAEAQKIIDETTAMADREQSDLLIGQLLHGWVPRTLDPDTEESVRAVKEAFGTFTGSARIGPQRTQLPRSTWEIVFPDGDVWRRFIGADGFLKNMTPEQLAAYKAGRSPEQVALIDGTIENMKRWEALTDPQSDEFVEGFADKFRPMSTDHLEVNRDWANGRFTALTGGDTRPGAYFDRTPGAAIANRFSQHERMVSARRLIEALAPSAFEVDPIVIRNAMNATGETRTSKYGVNMTMLAPMASTYKGLGRQVPAVRVGKETYRMLADEARNAIDSSLANSLSRNIHGMLFHETVADRLERLIEVTADPEHAGTMLRAYDHILAAWKMATLFSPSWPVFNMAGNVFFMLAGGVRPDHVFKHAVDIARAVAARNNPERLNAIELEINGQRVTAASLLESATHRSVFNNNYTTDTAAAMHIFDNTIAARPEHYLRTYLAPWLRANQFLENHSRMLAYVSYLEQGMDEASAAQKAIDAMIDYSDLSRVEQKVFRRVLPFYSWVRGNAGRQVQLMLEQPKWANLTPKLKEAIETAAAGEDQVPYDQRPGWMKEAMATQIGSDPEGRLSVMLRDALPTGDIMQILAPIVGPEGVQQFLHFFGSSLTPVVGVPLQLGAGREYFSGRSIGKDAYSGDETYGEFLRGATLRPVGEAVKIGQRIGQGRYGEAAARVLLGGRVQAFDQERLQTSVAREVRDEETRIQSAIRRAERNGDHAASTEARARLLRLYEDAQRRGVKIPQWAAEQLGVLTSPAA